MVLALGGTLAGIGFLPGSVEGVYSGPECMCDSFNFMQIKDGKVVIYYSGHPPAEVVGAYDEKPDGTVEILMTPLRPDEPDELAFRATPHLWFTRFESVEDGTTDWLWKRPRSGRVARIVRGQEIKVATIPNDKEMVTTYYDSGFNELRVETKPIRKPKAEQGVVRDPPPAPSSAKRSE